MGNKGLWSCVLAGAALCTGHAFAQAAQGTPPDAAAHAAFDSIDGNHAGRISLEEYRNFGVTVFHELDRNHDDRIDGKEHAGTTTDVGIVDFNTALREWFTGADTNGDGFLDWDEWSAAPVGPARAAKGETK